MQNIKETYLNLMGQQINPSNVAALSDGIYFKMAGGEKMRMFLKGGQWINPLAQAQEGEETIYADHDKAYDYKLVDGQWQARRKDNSEGEWMDLSSNEAATKKLNTAYPDALNVIEESTNNNVNDGINQEDLNSIVDDSGGQSDGLQLNKDNLKFVSPTEGNVLSPLGDNSIINLVGAIDATAKSFGKDGYYDPGTKADYTKFSHTNTTDEDLYIDPEALAKGKKTGDVLKDAEQMTEIEMQKYLDERAKNNPQMYDKVKNFDADLFEKTGHVDRRRGLFNRKVNQDDFKEGDYLENKYKDASHIGFSVDEMGKYTKGFDYLTANEDGETFNQQSFDGYQNSNSGGDDSREYERSDKHNDDYNFVNETSFESYRNAGINHNMNLEDDDPFGYTKIPSAGPLAPRGIKQIPTNTSEPELMLSDPTELYLNNIEKKLRKSQGPLDLTDPEAVINANDQISLDEANQRYADDLNGRGLRYGGSLPKAQNGLREFCANAPIIDTGGKVFAQCENREYDSEHIGELGATMSVGKLDDEFTSSFGLSGGYTFNPSGGKGGLKTYLGGNYGLRATENSSIDDGLNGTNVDMNKYMKGLASLGYTGEVGGDSHNWRTPTQFELGAYANKDLMGNDGTTFGGYGRFGPINIKAGYNRNTGSEFSAGFGLPIRKGGGPLKKMQFGASNNSSGYNPLTNQFTPINFNTELQVNPLSMNMLENQTQAPEKTEPFFNADDRMYAMNQAVNRSMDSFDAFSADMNKRMQNPTLQMNQVDTNPLGVPDFSNPELDNQMQMNQDMMAFKTASADGRTIGNTIIPTSKETKQNQKEFGKKMDETLDNMPKYEGTQENLNRFDRANELGFEGDLVAMDEYDQNETEEGIMRSLREEQLNKDNKDANPSFGDKLWNIKNRALDSKVGQTYQNIGAGGKRIASALNPLLRQREESKTLKTQMQNAYLSDNMFASRDADLSGSKGDYDVNSGIFRAEDKITTRQGKYGTEISNYLTFAKNGGSFYNDGGEAEIDANMYKELIAAGADLEII